MDSTGGSDDATDKTDSKADGGGASQSTGATLEPTGLNSGVDADVDTLAIPTPPKKKKKRVRRKAMRTSAYTAQMHQMAAAFINNTTKKARPTQATIAPTKPVTDEQEKPTDDGQTKPPADDQTEPTTGDQPEPATDDQPMQDADVQPKAATDDQSSPTAATDDSKIVEVKDPVVLRIPKKNTAGPSKPAGTPIKSRGAGDEEKNQVETPLANQTKESEVAAPATLDVATMETPPASEME